MLFSEPPQARLLVVESARSLREALIALFVEEGYITRGVSSLAEALLAVERQPYDVILADLFAGVSLHTFTPAHLLRRRAHPIPLGLLSAQSQVLEDPQRSGFAFALSWPIDVNMLLTEIAGCLKHPLDSEQLVQAQFIKRFLEAWSMEEWKSLLNLRTEEVVWYPSSLFPRVGGSPVQGKLAFLRFVIALRRRYQSMRIEAQDVYWRPHGLAAHTNSWVAEVGKSWETSTDAVLFAFAGERICQIGIPTSAQQWGSLTELPPIFGRPGRSS